MIGNSKCDDGSEGPRGRLNNDRDKYQQSTKIKTMMHLHLEISIHNVYCALLFRNNGFLEHYLKALLSIMGWLRALRYVIVMMIGYHDEKKSTCCMRSFMYS